MSNFLKSVLDWTADLSAWALPTVHLTDILDILVIAFLIYQLLGWIRKTRAWILMKGILVLFVVAAVAAILQLNMTLWIFKSTISVGILAVIIIFQPEFRKALEQLGRGNFLSSIFIQEEKDTKLTKESVESLIDSLEKMAAVKTGALICLEQKVSLHEYEQTGIPIDAAISSQLIQNIFEHNTPLHDGAMIVRDNRIVSATCYLPLSDNSLISKDLGTRHRAALGLSEVTDCKVLVVSEETGAISMASGGQLFRHIDGDFIRKDLIGENEEKKTRKKALRSIIGKKGKNQ